MPVIKLYANLRKLAGIKEVEITANNLRVAIEILVAQKQGLTGLLIEDGQIRPHIVITINGQLTTDLDAALEPGDIVAIFPPIAGG